MTTFLLIWVVGETNHLTLLPLQGYEDPQPPASKAPPTNSGLLYPQPVPEQPTPPAFKDPWRNYLFPQEFSEKPDGPAVGKPGGKEEDTPVIPVQPQPEPHKPQPDHSQSSIYWPFYHHPYPYLRPETPPLHPSKPEQVPEKQPDAPTQGPGYPPVYPTYPPQPGQKPAAQKPEAPPAKEYPFHPSHPEKQPEEREPVQKPHLPQAPPDKQPVVGPVPHPNYRYNYPKYIPYVTPPPALVGQEPIVPQPDGGGVVVPQSSPGVTPLYCVCPSGFGNCCPQIAFHQHHHHILPVAPGSRDVPPIYTGLPFVPWVALPGLDGGSGSPAPQTPNEPTFTFSPDREKQPYFQPPDGSLSAKPDGLPVNPEQAYAYADPQGVGQYWPYSPLSAGQASGEEAVNPVAQHHLYMMQPPKHQSSPGNMNYASAPHFFHPRLQQHAAKQRPRTASEVQSWSPYVMLQDAQEQTRNISAPSRSPPASSSANEHDQLVNASSESNSYLLLQRGPPGKVPHLFSESPFALRRPVHHGSDQGPGDTSPEKLRPSREKMEHPGWLRGTPTSFPSKYTLYVLVLWWLSLFKVYAL